MEDFFFYLKIYRRLFDFLSAFVSLESCEDKLSDCPLKAAKGDCWKTAKPPILGAGGVIKYSANRNYPMWDSCKKSCQRCDGKSNKQRQVMFSQLYLVMSL